MQTTPTPSTSSDAPQPTPDAIPDAEIAALEADSAPLGTLKALCDELHISYADANKLIDRVRRNYPGLSRELKRVKTSDLLDLVEDRAHGALEAIDDTVYDQMRAEGKGKDLAIVAGILLEKRQLLRGEPTHILSVSERQGLNQLVPMIVKEAARRGMLVSQHGPMVDVTPQPVERSVRPRSGRQTFTTDRQSKEVETERESGEPLDRP